MAETKMNVQLLAHSQLSEKFIHSLDYGEFAENLLDDHDVTDGQAVALTAIRSCYSVNKPTEIVAKEGAKYFGSKASDGGEGTDADRLFRHIFASKHTSTLEHISFTFAIEGVSRALLAQLTRHRVGFSFSVQSQRYVRMGRNDKSGGFDYVVPEKVVNSTYEDNNDYFDPENGHTTETYYPQISFSNAMDYIQDIYDDLREMGVPAEDARAVLPQAAATNLVMTANLTALLSFYSKRKKGRGAQAEITELAEALRREVVDVEPWTAQFFEEV
ncbi:FAD-dependent thymidylate synthase [Bacillus licheniformis]|uniref:FAD-dependent thymidylate synthase n=1 Tax=Bacillus licheniformis TaxID=1402 RepID=UPI001CD9D397|nr:FAD-dependent thymidylate synthase [Bacillus licheniformis]MDQ9094287.1 FAD-dependent thymidylate synthase [Bacillus licheniformis]MEC0479111.1 FAD-dependent thymidylate synthase [Bacillus licheniformis]MEC0490068.1 FAD-dependent thymidylate synthase [Bacillus licheniformis]